MNYLFTSESVSEGHPDKVADQISDAILDNYLAFDPASKVACETLVTTGQVILAGEIHSSAKPDHQRIVRDVIREIGYSKQEYMFTADSCGILSALHTQSSDIHNSVVRSAPEQQGAGDQGMMFGYATDECDTFIPLTLYFAHRLVEELAFIRKHTSLMPYLRPDAKSQVTLEYSPSHEPLSIHSIILSTQHDESIPNHPDLSDEEMRKLIENDVRNILIPRVVKNISPALRHFFLPDYDLKVNPSGKFVIGGPHGDTGLTGRKIIVDTYGGRGAHGGGAFSGKDPSKVDRSAAYAARHIAKNLVAAGICRRALIQVSYAIGVAEPCGVYLDTMGTALVPHSAAEISAIIQDIFPLTPYAIVSRLQLLNPIYKETASYGHMGREPRTVNKSFTSASGETSMLEVELFTWEKLDYVAVVRQAFNI